MVELRSSPEMMASLRPSATLFPHTRKARHDTKEHQVAQQPEDAGKLATVSNPFPPHPQSSPQSQKLQTCSIFNQQTQIYPSSLRLVFNKARVGCVVKW
jgi:hypothetical protein